VCRRGPEIVAVDARSRSRMDDDRRNRGPHAQEVAGGIGRRRFRTAIRLRISPRLGGTLQRRDPKGPASAQEWHRPHGGLSTSSGPKTEEGMRVSQSQCQAWSVHAAGQDHPRVQPNSSRHSARTDRDLSLDVQQAANDLEDSTTRREWQPHGAAISDNNPSSELAFARYIVRQQRLSSSQELLKAKPQDLCHKRIAFSILQPGCHWFNLALAA
jgi:hypothetical protein